MASNITILGLKSTAAVATLCTGFAADFAGQATSPLCFVLDFAGDYGKGLLFSFLPTAGETIQSLVVGSAWQSLCLGHLMDLGWHVLRFITAAV